MSNDMDLHVATNEIISLKNRVAILEARVHRMDWTNFIMTIATAAISGGLVNWLF
jgi:hypothetical protein